MPKKQSAKENENVLVDVAKAIGTAAGKVASFAGATAAKATKKTKLVKKNKARMPRRQKKALKKAAARH